jgi:uncharacterized membrane protein YeaQ/YmgE (transglycosylase-associated protein family)
MMWVAGHDGREDVETRPTGAATTIVAGSVGAVDAVGVLGIFRYSFDSYDLGLLFVCSFSIDHLAIPSLVRSCAAS